jgi:hypothetical protein
VQAYIARSLLQTGNNHVFAVLCTTYLLPTLRSFADVCVRYVGWWEDAYGGWQYVQAVATCMLFVPCKQD